MKTLIPITSALMLALAVPSVALAQNGNGKGGGKSEDARGGGNGGGGGQERGGGNENRGRGGDDRGGGNGNGNGRGRGGDDDREMRTEIRAMVRGDDNRGRGRGDSGRGGDDRREVIDVRRELDRRDIRISDDGRTVTVFRRDDDRGLIAGCPPGLAKKNNGCLPPGQAREMARAANADRYNWLWALGGQDRSNYRYDNGYLYQLSPQGSALGWLPVLGGALAPGAVWPQQYQWQQTPQYYSQYYGLNDRYDYRYADGALYGVDPQTNTISQVVALLTGQNFNVGQRLPAGYDIYNVPHQYRNQYADSADSLYRYNDGYVYQVDPTTQLIQTVIQLIT